MTPNAWGPQWQEIAPLGIETVKLELDVNKAEGGKQLSV